MDVKEISLLLSNVLVFSAYIIYIQSILKGKAKPHRTTRLVLLLITGLATFSLLAQNNQVAVWLAGISATMSAIIFILSIKHGMGGWEKIDIICLVIALIGIAMWKFTNNPAVALFSAIFADFTGVLPTLIKTYYHPKTEVWTFFSMGGLGALLNLSAAHSWTLEEISYPLYLFLVNILLVYFILRKNILNWIKNSFFR